MTLLDTIKTAALTLIVVFTCLMLLLTPDTYQGETMVNHPAVKPESVGLSPEMSPMRFESVQSTAKESVNISPVEQDKPVIATVNPPRVLAHEWPLLLYPELARIVELENLPTDIALGELLPMLSDEDPVVRLASLESLADVNHPAILPMLSAALDDPSPQIRIVALESLALQGNHAAISNIEPYAYDREPEVRIAAIEALTSFESDLAVNALGGLLTDQDRLIRHHAVNALGEIGGEYAASFLLQSRYDADETIRANAESILSELDDQSAY